MRSIIRSKAKYAHLTSPSLLSLTRAAAESLRATESAGPRGVHELTKLNQFEGDYVKADMVKSFTVSAEYRQRFQQ
jgi:hypothetical protein